MLSASSAISGGENVPLVSSLASSTTKCYNINYCSPAVVPLMLRVDITAIILRCGAKQPPKINTKISYPLETMYYVEIVKK